MIIDHATQAFHLRPFTERKRLSAPRVNHDEEMFLYHSAPDAPKHLQPNHRNLWTSAFPYKKAMDYHGHFEVQEMPVVRFENEFARVTMMPSIAGRVMEIFDKMLNRCVGRCHTMCSMALWTVGRNCNRIRSSASAPDSN